MAAGSDWMAFKGHSQAQLLGDSVILQQDPPSLEVLKELLEDLLSVCRVLSRRNFMPELHPATGMNSSSEATSALQGMQSDATSPESVARDSVKLPLPRGGTWASPPGPNVH